MPSETKAKTKCRRFFAFLKAWRNQKATYLAEGGDPDCYPFVMEAQAGRQLTAKVTPQPDGQWTVHVFPKRMKEEDQSTYSALEAELARVENEWEEDMKADETEAAEQAQAQSASNNLSLDPFGPVSQVPPSHPNYRSVQIDIMLTPDKPLHDCLAARPNEVNTQWLEDLAASLPSGGDQ